MIPRLVLFSLLTMFLAGATDPVGAEEVLRPDISRDANVPSPEDFLGYPLGSEFTPHHRIVSYCEALAASSDRVGITVYGESVEGRPLLLLTVSDPAHLEDTAALQQDYARLADPEALGAGERETLAGELPVAVWLSFGVHGSEASPSEAAMAVAYELASAQDDSTRRLLRESVVLLDPCLNPDGRDRYVHWFRSVRGSRPDPDPRAREHHEPWPGGRFNHYLFDLNRDWAWLTQPESRARVRAYLSWHPQVHVDLHEMEPDGSYFFFPPAKPLHPAFPPTVSKWAEIFGNGNAAAFDARGWTYYTGERFDLYYPGYGDTWPTFQGAVGMTYEQAGHSTAGLRLALADGDTLTLAERVAHHTLAALSTVAIAADHREERLGDFSRFFETDGRRGPAAYLFPPGPDPARTHELVDLLLLHGVRVDRAEQQLRPGGLRSYGGKEPPRELPAGTFLVSSEQPQWRFVQAVLEPETVAPDTFFYDLSAWSLPFAYGIEAYWTEQPVRGNLEAVTSLPPFAGRVVNPDAPYAFLIPWARNGAPRAAARLQEAGVEISFTTRKIEVNGVTFPPGSLVLFRKGNPPDLAHLVERVAREDGIEVTGVASGLTGDGPDLGSPRVVKLRRPRVAILADEPVDPSSAGAAWFLLDRHYPLPHSLLALDEITKESLRNFDVLVFPDDDWGGHGYELAVDSTRVAAVRTWIEEGGVYVGLGGGAFFASADKAGFSTVKEASFDGENADATEEEREAREQEKRLETQTEEEIRRREEMLPGTIFRVRVDPGKPLGFGYEEELMVLLVHNRALELGPPGTNVAWFEESSRVSGYATPLIENRLTDKPFLIDERRGAGHVVLFVSDPNFRLFWPGLTRLFLNALYFVPSLAAN